MQSVINIASLMRRCRCGKLHGGLSHLLLTGPARHQSWPSYITTIAISSCPTCIRRPRWRVPVGILPCRLVRKNFNGLATRWWKNFEDTFIRFDTIHERDGRTDRQTDRWTHRHCMTAKAVLGASIAQQKIKGNEIKTSRCMLVQREQTLSVV